MAWPLTLPPSVESLTHELPTLNDWKLVEDPYEGGKPVWVIPAITPDYAVIHATEVDRQGNVRISGTYHWDRIMSRAARSVLVTAERLVETAVFAEQPEATVVPHFMVANFAIVPKGAWPGSAWPIYEIDYPSVEEYLGQGEAVLISHLRSAPEATSGFNV